MTMIDISALSDMVFQGFSLALEYWWAYVPIMLGMAAYHEWAGYQRAKYLAGMKWVLLELVPPPDVQRSPRIAENIFAGLHASYGGGINWKTAFFSGKVPDWFSLEIVSNGGDIHFYIRCTESQRNTVEAVIFAQYPDAEVRQQLEDYINLVPDKFDPTQFDVSGNDFVFSKESAYPIKTWPEFEEQGGKDENTRIDPLAPLFETMSSLRPGEHLWLQYVIRPTGGEWVKENQKVVDKMKGKKEEKPKPPLEWLFGPIDSFFNFLSGKEPAEPKKEEKSEFNLQQMTAAQRQVLELVEFKLAKLAFKSTIRVLYVARKEAFNGSRTAGITAMFKQLFYNNMNSFRPGIGTRDKGVLPWLFINDKGFFADERTLKKKHAMYGMYRARAFAPFIPGGFMTILSTEELATLWHLPGLNVRAPLLPRVQAKKGQPPAILPTR
jgi:hypothetical protein